MTSSLTPSSVFPVPSVCLAALPTLTPPRQVILPVGPECVLCTAPPHPLPLSPFFPSVHQGAGGVWPVPDASKARRLCVAGDPGDSHLQPPQPATPMYHVCQLCPEVSKGGGTSLRSGRYL